MRYRIVAVGRLRRGFYSAGCDHYLKRLQAFGRAELIEVKDAHGSDAQKARAAEGEALLAAGQGRLVALDEHGRSLRSLELASRLDELELAGDSSLTLLLGGAEGLSEQVRAASDETWSLSPLTLPHELARLVVLEQLYRAETIRSGHPYHRQ